MAGVETSFVVQNRNYWYSETDQTGYYAEVQTDFPPFIWENSVNRTGPVPGYQRIIATGGCATTTLTGTKHGIRNVNTDITYEGRNTNPIYGDPSPFVRRRLVGQLFCAPHPWDLSTALAYLPEAENRARAKFYSRLQETQTAFSGAVFAGELRESLQLIRSPAQKLRRGVSDYLSALKRGSGGKSRKQRRSFVRDTWLEYSFGWQPLINDVYSATDAFLSSKWTKPIFTMVRGKGSAGEETLDEDDLYYDLGGDFKLSYRWARQANVSVKYYGVYHSVGSGPTSFSHFGFNLREFVPTLWELIPYSFLVDYFTNIGDILSSWSYRSIGCSWASRGLKAETLVETAKQRPYYENNSSDPYNSGTIGGSPGASSHSYTEISREPAANVPLPEFQLEVPGMKSLKWINIAALTTQLSSTRRSLNGP